MLPGEMVQEVRIKSSRDSVPLVHELSVETVAHDCYSITHRILFLKTTPTYEWETAELGDSDNLDVMINIIHKSWMQQVCIHVHKLDGGCA